MVGGDVYGNLCIDLGHVLSFVRLLGTCFKHDPYVVKTLLE